MWSSFSRRAQRYPASCWLNIFAFRDLEDKLSSFCKGKLSFFLFRRQTQFLLQRQTQFLLPRPIPQQKFRPRWHPISACDRCRVLANAQLLWRSHTWWWRVMVIWTQMPSFDLLCNEKSSWTQSLISSSFFLSFEVFLREPKDRQRHWSVTMNTAVRMEMLQPYHCHQDQTWSSEKEFVWCNELREANLWRWMVGRVDVLNGFEAPFCRYNQ